MEPVWGSVLFGPSKAKHEGIDWEHREPRIAARVMGFHGGFHQQLSVTGNETWRWNIEICP